MAKDGKMLQEIGNRLIAAREKAGLTQAKLAELANVEPNSIHRYEAGEREMGFTVAIRISKALNVGLRDLIPRGYIAQSAAAIPEEELLDIFYQLNAEDQKAMVRQMMALVFLKKQSA